MNDQIHKPQTGIRKRKVRPLGIWAAAVLFLCGLAFYTPMVRAWAAPAAEQVSAEIAGSENAVLEQTSAEIAGSENAAQGQTFAEIAGSENAVLEPVTLEVEYGYGNAAKGGRYLPVTVTIGNHQEVPLSGILQIKSKESDGTIYYYNWNIEIGPLSEYRKSDYIPLGSRADELYFTLLDRQEQVVLNKHVTLNVSWDVPELFIGILSDHPERLQYLDGVGVSYSTLRTRIFALKEEEFPYEEAGLNLLDVLVVNDYRLRKLSEEQTAAIMDWVHSGGVLILGTGRRVDDTLGRFAPELLDDSYGTPYPRHIDLGEDFPTDNPGEGMMEISCVDVPLHGGNVILSSSGFPILTAAAKEQGLIGVTAFDLADIAEFCEGQSAYVDYFFTSLLGEERVKRLAEVVYSGNSGKFLSVQSLINTGNVERLPHLLLYVVIVAVYLVLLGPGLYLFLKNRELQIYYRKGAIGLAVVFAVVIYVMGSTTRFKSTFYTYATIEDVTEDYVTDITYVNIRNPYNHPYTVELDPSYSLLPITRTPRQRDTYQAEFTGDEPYQIAIEREDDRVTVKGQNIVSFAPRYFQMERKRLNEDRIGITGEVDYFEGNISGTITNQFPFALENATLLLYGNMVYLDRMEAGETKKLDDLESLRFPLDNSYVLAEQITGEGQFQQTDINNTEYLLAMKRTKMLMFYIDNYMTGYTADARVIAFSTEKEESQFLKDDGAETFGLTMLTSSVEVNASRDRSLYRSVLMKTPKVVSGVYDANANSMTGSEPLTLEYQLGTDIRVESLTFEPVSEIFLRNDSDNYIEAFTGSVYFYNHATGIYDKMELEGRNMDVEELGPYLPPGNVLTVRYVYEGTGRYNQIQLPMPMVAGREQ